MHTPESEPATWSWRDAPLTAIARVVGTPTYVYDGDLIQRRARSLDAALGSYPHAIHYALKANSTLAIVRRLREAGCAADANSAGEIEVALRAGFAPSDIVFTGVGKTDDELARAVALGIGTINAESAGELARIEAIAWAGGRRARVALRVNPDVDAQSHPHISTGSRVSKFGVALEDTRALCRSVADRPGLQLVGLHVHVGSQVTSLEPLRRAVGVLVELATELGQEGVEIGAIDVGGGLGISYDGSAVPSLETYAEALLDIVAPTRRPLVVEPGRSLVGPAGLLLSRVVDVKRREAERWCVVMDAGMTELLRPALYGAYHRIEPIASSSAPVVTCDVVGPVCETSDTLGAGRQLPKPAPGDLMAVLDAGAYGSAMASNYNRRPMPAEVLVESGDWRVVRRRQTIEDMLACEE